VDQSESFLAPALAVGVYRVRQFIEFFRDEGSQAGGVRWIGKRKAGPAELAQEATDLGKRRLVRLEVVRVAGKKESALPGFRIFDLREKVMGLLDDGPGLPGCGSVVLVCLVVKVGDGSNGDHDPECNNQAEIV
jgi:hypothetical protein